MPNVIDSAPAFAQRLGRDDIETNNSVIRLEFDLIRCLQYPPP